MDLIRPERNSMASERSLATSAQRVIAISDANPVLSASIRQMFLEDSHLSSYNIISDTTCDLAILQDLSPQILILDPWQHMSCFDAISQRFLCLTSVVSVIGYCPDITGREARGLSLAGFRGILPKTVSGDELIRIVCAVAFGGVYLHESYSAPLAGQAHTEDADLALQSGLTERETDVLRHVALGCSMKEIATLMKISTKTVDTYKTRANQKLNLRTKKDIVRFAIQSGWMNC